MYSKDVVTPQKWLNEADGLLGHYLRTQEVPPKYPPYVTGTHCVCIPICCSPCIAWSVVWRLVMSPIKLWQKGWHHLLADNCCTVVTDACVESYTTEIFSHRSLPSLPAIETFSAAERERLLDTLDIIELIFNVQNSSYKRHHYILSEALFANTVEDKMRAMPYKVHLIVYELKQDLILSSD